MPPGLRQGAGHVNTVGMISQKRETHAVHLSAVRHALSALRTRLSYRAEGGGGWWIAEASARGLLHGLAVSGRVFPGRRPESSAAMRRSSGQRSAIEGAETRQIELGVTQCRRSPQRQPGSVVFAFLGQGCLGGSGAEPEPAIEGVVHRSARRAGRAPAPRHHTRDQAAAADGVRPEEQIDESRNRGSVRPPARRAVPPA